MWLLKDATKCQEEVLAELLMSTSFKYEFQDVKTAALIS